MRIVFLGTPDFAVASLRALVEDGREVVAVVTAPDKPAGRGLHMQASAVKMFAESQGIPVLQPEKLKNPDFLIALRSYQADIQVVVAFRMLPELVWNMPPLGTVNVHASLLPQYRGAAPINWAIMEGEKKTGVTTFRLKQAIDTGNILMQEEVDINEEDTAGSLHDKLMVVGAALLVRTLNGIENGTVHESEQIETPTTKHAPKIFTETCRINWQQSCQKIHNQIRGLSPFPGAFTMLQEKQWKLFASGIEYTPHHLAPGTVMTDGKEFLKIACADGFIHIKELQVQGKKRLATLDFLRGFRPPEDGFLCL